MPEYRFDSKFDKSRSSILSPHNDTKSTRSLFSSKSGKRKIKLIKNIKVIGAVREKVHRHHKVADDVI